MCSSKIYNYKESQELQMCEIDSAYASQNQTLTNENDGKYNYNYNCNYNCKLFSME